MEYGAGDGVNNENWELLAGKFFKRFVILEYIHGYKKNYQRGKISPLKKSKVIDSFDSEFFGEIKTLIFESSSKGDNNLLVVC